MDTTQAMPTLETATEPTELHDLRRRFRLAVEAADEWRQEARLDYDFWAGKQWDAQDIQALRAAKRPALTINKVRPLINLLSGYQRLNRYEPEFLPRTPNDVQLAQIRKGVTKWVMDQTDFDEVEGRCFTDQITAGLVWGDVAYDPTRQRISIRRVSGMDVYPAPEWWRTFEMEDCPHVFTAKWVQVDELARIYPEYADEVRACAARLAEEDDGHDIAGNQALWWDHERRLVRLVTCWERLYDRYPDKHVAFSVFAGDLLLEADDSPYEHGELPLVPLLAYAAGEGDIPAGVVRDLRDLQREINKRRSQWLDIINRQSNSGWMYREGSLDAGQEENLRRSGSQPGVVIKYQQEAPTRIEPSPVPPNLPAIEDASRADFQQVSGINEAMIGQDMPASTSGRAIELRQRQATTQIALLFDRLRIWKRDILRLLWGDGTRRGLIQQYYSGPFMVRIVGDGGEQGFAPVNQQVPMQDALGLPMVDPWGNAIMQTVNDLSAGEFDIVISDAPATATQRMSNFYALIEAAKAGIQIPPDVLLEASDLPQKEQMKQRMLQAQQAQMAQAQQMGAGPGAPPPEMGGPMDAAQAMQQMQPIM